MRILKFILLGGLSLLCELINAESVSIQRQGKFEVVTKDNSPCLCVQIDTKGLNSSESESNKWYQVRWTAKSVDSPPSKQEKYGFKGELDAYSAVVTSIKFIKWPRDKKQSSYYEFNCRILEYLGDDSDGTTIEPPPPAGNFAEATLKFKCFWKDEAPMVLLSAYGNYEDNEVKNFDVTVSEKKTIESVSIEIGQQKTSQDIVTRYEKLLGDAAPSS